MLLQNPAYYLVEPMLLVPQAPTSGCKALEGTQEGKVSDVYHESVILPLIQE